MGKKIPLTDAARRLGVDYQQCRRLIGRGVLKGGRDEFGRLYVDARALAAAEARRQKRRPSRVDSGGTDDAAG